MIRIVLLSLAGFVVLIGFGLPFLIPGRMGLLAGFAGIVAGSVIIWTTELRTRRRLEGDNRWNRLMKADGENLVEHEDSNRVPD